MDELRSTSSVMATNTALTDPFFIVGSERSGTTLLRLMLQHHPDIECAPEFEFLVEQMTPEEGYPELATYHAWLETNRIFVPHELNIDRGLSYPALVRSFLEQYCNRTGKSVRGATCHKHFDRLPRIWPEAKFVHLLRDGRDVARSCIGMGWAGNVWHGAQGWLDAEVLWDTLARRTRTENLYELRFEDLIKDTEGELGRLCEFLGTSYSPAMMDYERASTYSRPDPKLVEQWRKKLSPLELGLLENRIGERLAERGYPKCGVDSTRVGFVRRALLALQNRVFRFRFRCRRYGFAHIALAKFARCVGWETLEVQLLVKQNEIDNGYIK